MQHDGESPIEVTTGVGSHLWIQCGQRLIGVLSQALVDAAASSVVTHSRRGFGRHPESCDIVAALVLVGAPQALACLKYAKLGSERWLR